MVSLITELIDILGQLISAEETAGAPQTFSLYFRGGSAGPMLLGGGWPDDGKAPSEHAVDELNEEGWVRISERKGKTRTFAITDAGRRAWIEHRSALGPGSHQVDLSWEVVRPTLISITDQFTGQGASRRGVPIDPPVRNPSPDQAQQIAAVRALEQAGYLQEAWRGPGGMRNVQPTAKALELLRGWPTGPADNILQGLTDALQNEIDQTAEPLKKSKLIQARDVLLGAGRDVALTYFRSGIADLPHPHL